MQGYYLRDDGELMIEMQPGEFVSETARAVGWPTRTWLLTFTGSKAN